MFYDPFFFRFLQPIAAPQFIAPGAMGFAMAPAYGGYPVVNSTVIPIAQTPIAAPMMVMPAYGPSCVRVPVYTNSTNPATGMVASQGHPPMVSRPKPLTQEVNSYSLQIVLISKFYSPF